MSYNCDSILSLEGTLVLAKADFDRLLKKYCHELPEQCFLVEQEGRFDDDAEEDEVLVFDGIGASLTWCGEGSGYSYVDVFLKEVVPCLKGKADFVLTWEGGDSITGLRIKDGKAVEMDVAHKLVPKKERKRRP